MSTRIGEAIRAERTACGMTLRTLARHAGMSWSFLSQFEHGKRIPRPEMVLKIANVFPSVDSAEWLWLMLSDSWSPQIAEMMRARAVSHQPASSAGMEGKGR